MGKKTKSGRDNRSSYSRNYIDKRYFGKVPDNSYFNYSPKNGYVIYQRAPNMTSFWYQIWEAGTKELTSMLSSVSVQEDDYSSVGSQLISLANAELNKEAAVIQKALKVDVDVKNILEDKNKFKEFLTLINQLIIGKKEFAAAVKRVKNAINKGDELWAPAPNISSLFLDQFIKDLSYTFKDIIMANVEDHKSEFYNGDFSSIMDLLTEAYQKQFGETFKNIINNSSNFEKDSVFGEQEDYKELLQYIEDLEQKKEVMKEVFERLYKKIPLDQILGAIKNSSKEIAENLKKGKKNAPTLGIETQIKKANFTKSTSTGGTVAEVVINMLTDINIKSDIFKGGSSYTFNPKSETMKIDQGLVISFKVDNIEEKIKDSFEKMNKTTFKNLTDAANKVSDFTKEVLDKVDDSFIIYSNQKMYSLGDKIKKDKENNIKGRYGFAGFSGGNSRKVTSLRDIAAVAGNKDDIDKLVILALNAISGAYLSGSRAQINEAISLQLANFFAYLFFDDWISFAHEESIGNVVHVFNLEGINFPLSYLLFNLGQALQEVGHNTRSILTTNISYGDGILFENQKKIEGYHPTEQFIINAWNRQRKAAEESVTFKVHFLKGFKDIFNSFEF